MKRSYFFLGLFLLAGVVTAQSYRDFYTDPVSLEDGDTISTFQITVSTTTTTLIDAAEPTVTVPVGTIPGRSYRKRTVHNTCAFSVYIGSNTSTLASTGYDLVGSSTSAPSIYTTYNKAGIYGLAHTGAGASGCVVTVIRETNSIP